MGIRGSVLDAIKVPLGAVLMLIVTLVLAGMTIAATISGDLTAAATRLTKRINSLVYPICHIFPLVSLRLMHKSVRAISVLHNGFSHYRIDRSHDKRCRTELSSRTRVSSRKRVIPYSSVLANISPRSPFFVG